MMQGRRMLVALAGAAALLAIAAAGTHAVSIRAGSLVIDADGSVIPKALPATRHAPIAFELEAELTETAGEPLPAAERFVFDADRQGRFDTKDLPVCPASRLRGVDTRAALHACDSALVGRGTTSAELHFEGQSPVVVTAPLLMFHGGSPGGKVLLLMHVYAKQPIPTTFVVRGVVSRGSGPFGTHTVVDIPEIAGGNGSLRSFSIRIHRTWTKNGKTRSFLIARCQSGRYLGRVEFKFTDGTVVQGTVVKRCNSVR